MIEILVLNQVLQIEHSNLDFLIRIFQKSKNLQEINCLRIKTDFKDNQQSLTRDVQQKCLESDALRIKAKQKAPETNKLN